MLHGLHHVRFLTLEEIAVYSVMMQRQPIQRAAPSGRSVPAVASIGFSDESIGPRG